MLSVGNSAHPSRLGGFHVLTSPKRFCGSCQIPTHRMEQLEKKLDKSKSSLNLLSFFYGAIQPRLTGLLFSCWKASHLSPHRPLQV